MSQWVKGRIREKNGDSSHCDDFYRYGNFGIEHDSSGSWEAYTIVDEKPILATDGLGSFEEAVDYFKRELASKELKDKGDDKNCKIKGESPEPPTHPEEDSSGMRLEIFLKSAEGLMCEYQGFTKAGTDSEKWHANGESDKRANAKYDFIRKKLFENNPNLDSSAVSAMLDQAYNSEGPPNGSRSKYYHTLSYMGGPFAKPSKYYKRVLRNQRNLAPKRDEKGNILDKDKTSPTILDRDDKPALFMDKDDVYTLKGRKYQNGYDDIERTLKDKSKRDVPLLTDDMTWDMARRYLNRGFNPNYGQDARYPDGSDPYFYELFPQISGFLPETKVNKDNETVFSGAPRNPFKALSNKGPQEVDKDGKPVLDGLGQPMYSKIPVLDKDGNQINVLDLRKLAYHTPSSETMVNRSVRASHTPVEDVFDEEVTFPETYAKTTEEAVKGMLDDPKIYSLMKVYYALMRGKAEQNLERGKEITDWANQRGEERPTDVNAPDYEKRLKEFEDKKKAHEDRLAELDYNDDYNKLIGHIYKELNDRAEDYLKKNASMRVYYDIMKNGATATTDNGTKFSLPIRYVPIDMKHLSYVPTTDESVGDKYPQEIDKYEMPLDNYVSDKDSDVSTFFYNLDQMKAKKKAEEDAKKADEGASEEPKQADSRKDVKTPKDVSLMNKLEAYRLKNPPGADYMIELLNDDGDRIGYNPETGSYAFPANRKKKGESMEDPESKTETEQGTETKTEAETKTESAKKSDIPEMSAEDILNSWTSGDMHLVRDPWMRLVLDAGSKESDPLTIHDDSGNIMFNLRHI